jgi:hypothetical protein
VLIFVNSAMFQCSARLRACRGRGLSTRIYLPRLRKWMVLAIGEGQAEGGPPV